MREVTSDVYLYICRPFDNFHCYQDTVLKMGSMFSVHSDDPRLGQIVFSRDLSIAEFVCEF